MPTVRAFAALVESLAPPAYAFPGDPVGLHVGNLEQDIQKLCVSLDPTSDAVAYAVACGCQALLVHHPLIYEATRSVTTDDRVGSIVRTAIQHELAVMCAHTNLDNAQPGINDRLAEIVELQNVRPFGSWGTEPMWLVATYCPAAHADAVMDAAFAAGAGTVGNYTECAFVSVGTGQFNPGTHAKPFVGDFGVLNAVEETRIEMTATDICHAAVVAAIRRAHPYEQPVVSTTICGHVERPQSGRIGELGEPLALIEFSEQLEQVLGCGCDIWCGNGQIIKSVAVCGGAASGEWRAAAAAGADAFVTGEVRLNHAVEASAAGMAVIQAGHYATEQPGIVAFGEVVAARLGVDLAVFEPEPGIGGRPLLTSRRRS